MTVSAGLDGEVIVKTGVNDEYHSLWISIFSCSICYGTVQISSCSFSFIPFPIYLSVFFFFLIIFSHFLFPVGAVKWPIVKEQTVCI